MMLEALMRSFALLAVAALATSPSPARAAPSNSKVAAPSLRVEYLKPTNPEHEALYADLRERRLLEQVAAAISVIRLPKPLTLAFRGCDGDSNAYYDPERAGIVFCYEYVADIVSTVETLWKANPGALWKASKPEILSRPHPPRECIDGPIVFVLFHETAHAVFHLRQVPVLGKEEDAADSFAAVSLLRMGDETALRMLKGAAWAYNLESQKRELDVSDFSDSHSLDSQRYYNILCLAYGSDEKFFGSTVTSGLLPEQRAAECASELQQARFAMKKLVMPSIGNRELRRDLVTHGAKKKASR
jgi:Putative metallopeptidase